jgi:hypothetical protein
MQTRHDGLCCHFGTVQQQDQSSHMRDGINGDLEVLEQILSQNAKRPK